MTLCYNPESKPLSLKIQILSWRLFGEPIFRIIPTPLFSIRSALLRCFGAKIGKNVRIYPSVRIWLPSRLNIGPDVGVGEGVYLYNKSLISIASGSILSRGSFVATASHDYNSPGFELVSQPVIIGKLCWIASSTIILPGITIADGSVIGAGSVVTRDTVEWTIHCGNPARAIKKRSCAVKSAS